MSLRVWLPLNGTLENKGLDDITPVLTGAVVVDNEGKIGKCYKFGTSLGRITIPPAVMRNYTECSITFWVNILGWQTNWDTFFQAGLGSTPWNNYIFGVLRNSGNSVVFTISDASSSSQGNYKSSDLTLNTWYHLGFTYKSGHCCIYVNGNLYKDYSTNIIPNFSGINYISLGQVGNASSYQTNCKMNDIRLYDHALSPMEVKQISQGLILHYPLNRNGWGQENLLPCGGTYTQSSPWTTTLNRTDGYAFVTNSGFEATPGKIYTISVECDGNLYSNHGGTHDPNDKHWTFWAYISNINTTKNWQNGGYDVPINLNSSNNNYRKIGNTHVWTITLTDSQKYIGLRTNSYSNGTDNVTINWWNMKIEEGDKFTGWLPNSSSALATTLGLNDNIEYDTSGYGNNGTRTGTFSWTSDTPKYNVSTGFVDGCSINTINTLSNPCLEFSIAGWVNLMEGYTINNGCHLISFNGTYCRICISKDSKAVRVLLTDGTTNYMGGSALTDSGLTANKWNYFVITFKEGIIKIYINGLLDADLTATITQIKFPSSNISIGQFGSEKPKAKVSDIRFYSTALSAEDVKSLYNNSAYIDNQGNIYGAVYEEV